MFRKITYKRPPEIEDKCKGTSDDPTGELPFIAGVILTLFLGVVIGWFLCFLFSHVGINK